MGTRALFSTKIVPPIFTGGDSAPFTPASISGLSLWLDASDTSTITHSGGSVSQWDDKSGNGYHATQATGANQPVTNTRTIGGRNAIEWTGATKFFDIPNSANNWSGARTMVFCYLPDTTSNNAYLIDRWTKFVIANQRSSFGTATLNKASPTSGTGIIQIVSVSGNTTGVTQKLKINADTELNGITDMSDTSTTSHFRLGYGHDTWTSFDGAIGECLFYDRDLTNSERNQIGAYLASKWGITWTNI